MKRFTIFTISSILFLNSVFSQYKPLLQENAEWYVYHWFEASCNETYSIQGDSIVDETVYKKFIANPYCGWNTEKITLLREDVSAKKVYKLLH